LCLTDGQTWSEKIFLGGFEFYDPKQGFKVGKNFQDFIIIHGLKKILLAWWKILT
jgi:hypothetical protein